ncbi:MAG TPA: dihydroorotase [Devosia sp.]|nr:dihydroorotase [Devosia sp.]
MSGRPLIVENARIVDPASGFDAVGALRVEGGRIAAVSAGAAQGAPEGAIRVDAKGLVLAPGLVDLRVFTGEPGREYRETLQSAGEAAAAGGVTSFLAMPDTQPAIDDGALVDYLARRAQATCKVRVLPAAAITKGLKGEEITEFGLLREAGAVAFTDGRHSIQSSAVLRSAFSYAANFDMPVLHHVRDNALAGEGVMNDSLFASVLGLKGIPGVAETIPLARDLELAAATGVRYHAAQVSTARSVELLADAKRRSGNVSAGVSINNLSLNENDVGAYRTFFRLNPPLRSEDDRRAMIEGLRSGAIDTIHSDHDPQDTEVKRQPFAEASDGAIGLETMLAAALRLHHSGDIDLMTLLRAMTSRPAEILGIDAGTLKAGAPADFILIDLDYPWQVKESDFHSRSRNTAFEGARLAGKVAATYVAGQRVFEREGVPA